MSSDHKSEDKIYIAFTTRAFATGIPTVLAGSPVVSAYEDASFTQITAGITLGVDHDSVVGLNMLSITATAANGYDTGKDYNLVITTGTVGGVSVVGEVVGRFTLDRSPAAQDLANGTDGLGVLKTDIGAIPTTAMRGTDSAALASVCTETRLAELDAGNLPTDVAAIPTTAMRGTDSAALASVATEARLAELDAANLPSDVDSILAGTITNAAGADVAADIIAVKADTAAILTDTGTTLPAQIATINITKNAISGSFEFLMTDSTNNDPSTGLTVTATRSIDGGAFASCANAVSEVGVGIYKIILAAADTNGDIITLRFTAASSNDTFHTFKTVTAT